MARDRVGLQKVKEWYDQLELVLSQSAKLSGLYDHNGTIGDAREFFVRRVLRSILPPIVHIGRGQIIGAHSDPYGGPSKQIDFIIYDPRFPVLESEPGMGLYFIDGVIAVIEVKSRLDKNAVLESLDNCTSVFNIRTRENVNDLGAALDAQMQKPEQQRLTALQLQRSSAML